MTKLQERLAPALALCLLAIPARTQERTSEPFPNAHLLVTTAWVAEHGRDDGVRLVDVRSTRDYEAGHVPGAVSVPTTATFMPKGPRMMLGSAEQIGKLFGGKGIDRNTHVVLYDEGRSTAAARVFWTLEVYGHPRVSVVDGGFARWMAEGRDVTKDVPGVTAKVFVPERPSSALSTLETLMEDVEEDGVVMLDARTRGEYGRGRIPEAVHIEWVDNFTKDDFPVFRSPEELRKLYAGAGVTQNIRVHTY